MCRCDDIFILSFVFQKIGGRMRRSNGMEHRWSREDVVSEDWKKILLLIEIVTRMEQKYLTNRLSGKIRQRSEKFENEDVCCKNFPICQLGPFMVIDKIVQANCISDEILCKSTKRFTQLWRLFSRLCVGLRIFQWLKQDFNVWFIEIGKKPLNFSILEIFERNLWVMN